MTQRCPRPRFRGVCAIHDQTNETTQICDDCRADPVNKGWRETWEDVDEFIENKPSNGVSAGDLSEPKLHDATRICVAILDLFARGLYCRSQVFDKRGHSRGRRWGYLQLTYRDVAWLVGCSHVYVLHVIHAQMR